MSACSLLRYRTNSRVVPTESHARGSDKWMRGSFHVSTTYRLARRGEASCIKPTRGGPGAGCEKAFGVPHQLTHTWDNMAPPLGQLEREGEDAAAAADSELTCIFNEAEGGGGNVYTFLIVSVIFIIVPVFRNTCCLPMIPH